MFTPSKGLKLVCAAGALAVVAACGGGSEAAAPTLSRPASYVLKWSDEFNTVGAPGSAWTYDLGSPLLGGTVWGNGEQQYYTSDPANVSVNNGMLTIQPVQEGVPSGAPAGVLATSARIKTDTPAYYNALNATPYGFYEIRAKVPCVAGAWPAIWMMGRYGEWPARGEVDIMEWFGGHFASQPNQVQSAVHTTSNNWLRNSPGRPLYGKSTVTDLCSQFHLFQLLWTANEIAMGVDGVPTFTYRKPANANASNWPFDQPAHLILNVALGGDNGGVVDVSKLPTMAMQVDYVKVWQAP